jgi:hypothetical protein
MRHVTVCYNLQQHSHLLVLLDSQRGLLCQTLATEMQQYEWLDCTISSIAFPTAVEQDADMNKSIPFFLI